MRGIEKLKELKEYIALATACIMLVAAILSISANNKPPVIYVKQETILNEKEFKSIQEVSTFEQQKSGIPEKETTK